MEKNIEEDNHFIIEKETKFNFDELVETMGYQCIHYKIIIACFMMNAIEGSYFTFMATFLIPLEKYFVFDSTMMLILSSVIFIGVGLGSFSIGYLVPYFSRVSLIKYNMFSFLILSSFLIFTTNIYLFTIIRFIIGFNIGVFDPIMINVLCELLPIRNRSFYMIFVYSGFGVGQISNFIFALLLNKNFEAEKIESILIAMSIYYLILIIPFLLLITETYRNLLIKGKDKIAFTILKEMLENVRIELTDVLKENIKKSIKSSDNIDFKPNFKSLFSKSHFYISIVSTLLYGVSSALFYGPILIYSKTLQDLHISDNEDIILSGILLSIGGSIFLVIVGIIINTKYIGLKMFGIIVFVITWSLTLAIIIWTDKIKYLLVTYFILTGASFNAVTTMICLLYPTVIRDFATGYLNSCFRFGAFISQLVFLGTYYISIKVPYIILCVTNAIIIILIFLINKDPTNIPLDHNFEIELVNKEQKDDNENNPDKEIINKEN